MKANLISTIVLFTVSIGFGIVDGRRNHHVKHHPRRQRPENHHHSADADASAAISSTPTTPTDAEVRLVLDKSIFDNEDSKERRVQRKSRLVRRELYDTEASSADNTADNGADNSENNSENNNSNNNELAECELSYANRITDHCRYPGMDKPCFKEDATEKTTSLNPSETFAQVITTKSMAQNCCKDGRKCSTQEFEKLCCRTPSCLSRCYGSDFYTQRKKFGLSNVENTVEAESSEENAEAASRSKLRNKDRRGSVSYRFLDILARPNPSRPQRKSFDDVGSEEA